MRKRAKHSGFLRQGVRVSIGILAFTAFAVSARANLITNGAFETGTPAGWTIFTTGNGTNGTGLPDVTSFDTTGGGDSLAAHFNVGEVAFTGSEEGGGLTQTVMAPTSGIYTFWLDIASLDSATSVNSAAGLFKIRIDGTTVDSADLGAFFTPDQILRGNLSGTLSLSAGLHSFQILMTRPYLANGSDTPEQYIDNASLTSAAVTPEPGTLVLSGTGLLGFMALVLWRRRQAVA